MEKRIQIEGPYNFFQALKRLTIDPLHHIQLKKQFIKVPIVLDKNPVVVNITQVGNVENPVFELQTSSTIDEESMLRELNRIFHWDTPLQTIYEHYQGTELEELFHRFRGTPFVCDFNLYGSLMKTIIHQQLNMSFAYELSKRFVMNYGFEMDGAWFYPSPEKVSTLTVSELRELQFSQRKAEYVIDTSRLIVEGKLDLDRVSKKTDEEVIQELVKIRGIGRWTAECFLMFGLGRLDLFPVQDIGIQNGLKKLYGLDKKPSIEFIEEKSVDWKPYRSYASLYLWESIEVE